MALLALLFGSFLVAICVAAIGVVFQDRMEKIAMETRAGRSLRWLFLFPVLDWIEKFIAEHLQSSFRRVSSIVAAIAAILLFLAFIAVLIYLLTNHPKATLLVGAVALLAAVFAARRP
jgi:hypothetical protein